MPSKSKHSKSTLIAEERAYQAFELKKAGATYRQIGEQLGISAPGAYYAVKRAVEQMRKELKLSVGQHIEIQNARLEDMVRSLWPTVRNPKTSERKRLAAIDRVIKIMQRQAALLGLDTPRGLDADFGTIGEVRILIPDNRRDPNKTEANNGNGDAEDEEAEAEEDPA